MFQVLGVEFGPHREARFSMVRVIVGLLVGGDYENAEKRILLVALAMALSLSSEDVSAKQI